MNQTIKLVDGFKIRNTVDVEFAMIGDNSKFTYIPVGQIWIEKYHAFEKEFILKYFLRRKMLSKKIGYEGAKTKLRPSKIQPLTSVSKTLIVKIGLLKIFLVDGFIVRKQIDPGFCLGGHYMVYRYIPKNELWLDVAVDQNELPYILTHELRELELMKHGMSYNNAHDHAHAAEKEARRNDGVAKYPKD